MCDHWLHSTAEYHITVPVAQKITRSLVREKRRIVKDGPVATSFEDGAIQK
ncbi:MAG: hypothetical protein NVSMB6_24080 [Burkholderiaceae bacterium]